MSNSRVPAAEYPFRHKVDLQIRFNDIDMLGHLNNSVYLEFMDLGKSRYFEDVMPEGVNYRHINVVIVNVNVSFYAPTYIHEPIAVLTQGLRISERSFHLEQRVVNTDTGEVKCMARTVMAGFDPDTAQGAPIDASWAEALCKYEGRDMRVNNI